MKITAVVLALLLSGCAIADRSDKFGADLEFSLGGVLASIVDVNFKASVGFSKTCKEEDNGPKGALGGEPLGFWGSL